MVSSRTEGGWSSILGSKQEREAKEDRLEAQSRSEQVQMTTVHRSMTRYDARPPRPNGTILFIILPRFEIVKGFGFGEAHPLVSQKSVSTCGLLGCVVTLIQQCFANQNPFLAVENFDRFILWSGDGDNFYCSRSTTNQANFMM